MFTHLFMHLFIHPLIRLSSFHLLLWSPLCSSICLSICLSAHSSICSSILLYWYIPLSILSSLTKCFVLIYLLVFPPCLLPLPFHPPVVITSLIIQKNQECKSFKALFEFIKLWSTGGLWKRKGQVWIGWTNSVKHISSSFSMLMISCYPHSNHFSSVICLIAISILCSSLLSPSWVTRQPNLPTVHHIATT